jgi:AraC-like DNA-binding protein
MMLTQMFILVYMLLPHGFMKIYTIWYSLFMLYFAANFISFLGSHRLLLDAFAHRALSGRDLVELIESRKKGKKTSETPAPAINEAEYRKLEKALDKWVEEKRYREYDKSREQIARELNTSKEILHHYFITRKGVDFKTWRTVLRIEEAKRLLLEDKDASTNIIAEVAGFSDRSNFHRQFVKIVGCSPKQWRDSDGNPER